MGPAMEVPEKASYELSESMYEELISTPGAEMSGFVIIHA